MRFLSNPLCILTALSISFVYPGPSHAQILFDFERPVFIDSGHTVKDHAVVHRDGTFHIFYIWDDETSFGHASSSDLRHWTVHEPALRAGPSEWDSHRIWAPCVIEYPPYYDFYLMYYTGVNTSFAQRTCLAYSAGASVWAKAPAELLEALEADTSWAQWDESEWSDFRDPCFFTDGGKNYLVQTARTRTGLGALALKESNSYFSWEDSGPLYVHGNSNAIESSTIIKRNGSYHLFFTEANVGGISHIRSDSLRSGWNIDNRIIIDGGHAAELLDTGFDSYLFSRHSTYSSPSGVNVSTIRFDTLTWDGDSPAIDMPAPPGGGWEILWGDAFDRQPVFGHNPMYRGDDTTRIGFEGNWWIGTYESFNGPLRGAQPGDYQGDEPRGAIRSPSFTITGKSMKLMVGGGNSIDSCYVALCRAGSDDIIYKETGSGSDTLENRYWDLAPLIGMEVYILIVDDSSAPLGHINVDSIEERPYPAPPVPGEGDPEEAPGGSKKKPRIEIAPSHDRAERQQFPHSVSNSPNPFNPATELYIESRPDSRVSVIIYSVTGQLINRLDAVTDGAGRAAVRWDGRDSAGRPASAGMYTASLRLGAETIAIRKLILLR